MSKIHPRTFATQGDLDDFVARIKHRGSFSELMFANLAQQVSRDFKSDVDWGAAYSGCDIDSYLHLFSYEPAGGYKEEIRSEHQLREAAHVADGKSAPRGAAIVAARAALYASLLKKGAPVPGGGLSFENSAALAKTVLRAWAARGFKDAKGRYFTSPAQFCTNGKRDLGAEIGMPLQISRGVVYSVFAEDLLIFLGILSSTEATDLNEFHVAMDSIISTGQVAFARFTSLNDCEFYNNQVASHVVGRLAIAALLGEKDRLFALIDGKPADLAPPAPLLNYFGHAFYGEGDDTNSCFINTGPDGHSSRPSFSTVTTALGEIDDRYRNSNPLQSIGYSAIVVTYMYRAAELLRNVGLDFYSYRGVHDQSIENATRFFGCYVQNAGFGKTVSSTNALSCPNFPQYDGKVINGVEENIVIGSYRFPNDLVILQLENLAKRAWRKKVADPLLYGRWND